MARSLLLAVNPGRPRIVYWNVADEREQALIAEAQRGSRDAFCELAEAYVRRIHTLAFHFTGNAAEAEDLSQEAWLRAFRQVSRFRGGSSFYTWMRRIAVNTFLDSRKSAFWKRSAPIDEAREATYEMAMETRLLLREVWSHLDCLSPAERMTVLLRYLEGLTIEEIAAARATSAGTVKKLLNRAVTKLRNRLGEPVRRAAEVLS
jgi:RNA polymerase sigma-70 factor, ECF subfamily